jgi:predicted acylesterase/phospholipase RssA
MALRVNARNMQILKETFAAGAEMIEDLWLPFFCVSTNLSKSQVQVHQLGPLWQLVRASMTIVGMVPPVIREGEMLVDGGYLNNMPVDVMHSLGVHTVIVVRLYACSTLKQFTATVVHSYACTALGCTLSRQHAFSVYACVCKYMSG